MSSFLHAASKAWSISSQFFLSALAEGRVAFVLVGFSFFNHTSMLCWLFRRCLNTVFLYLYWPFPRTFIFGLGHVAFPVLHGLFIISGRRGLFSRFICLVSQSLRVGPSMP